MDYRICGPCHSCDCNAFIAASGLIDDDSHKTPRLVIALIGGIAAALFTGFRPNEYASGFDAAQATLRSALRRHALNAIDDTQLALEYDKACNFTLFRYPSFTPTSPLRQPEVPGSPSAKPNP